MPPYLMLGELDAILVTGLGSLLVLVIALARCSRVLTFSFTRRSERELEDGVHHFGGDVSETERPTPWLVWLVFVGYFVWAVTYIVLTGQTGV